MKKIGKKIQFSFENQGLWYILYRFHFAVVYLAFENMDKANYKI